MPEIITSYPAVLGAVLQFYRKKQTLSQGDIAREAGVNTSTWSRIENGETAMTVEQLAAAAEVMCITPSELLRDVETKILFLKERGVITKKYRTEVDRITKENSSLAISLAGAALAALFISFPFEKFGSSIAHAFKLKNKK
ncbi:MULTISPECIES: helix-turn-helix domain-containing protein [Komagataeibacter]|uniref:Helix-turn-helix transcriptional regulator n=1 Tax=Komagataeibacter oboediens TaxID=65958 RepID=A0ABS5SS91_9PROT|nr:MULTISPECIES: helix-turn-helix transcriptional regulator [Komagataeibacter]MBT0677008.1 helix-turn-helix transcriptional regulator [Komagataeibacter oboediens]MBT0680336.1 helix-turn-helix transcriptional regulator [Komagataeibacter oboediens]